MTASIARARADLAAGRAWQARDRLNGLLAHRQDAEVLDLLATVHYEMHDLPAAGALWFVTGRDDEMAHASVAAWRDRHGNDEARWLSIPGPVRRRARSRHLSALEGAAKRVRAGRRPRWNAVSYHHSERWWERFEPAIFGALAIWALAMMGIGMWTVIQWIAS
ncbi:MAG: DUF6584 family protein [Marmoricola sp.]